MSVAAIMMVRDEADIVGHTIRHLLAQVDHVYVADNRSVDGTSDIVRDFGESSVSVTRDDEVAYRQSEKTTRLARWAMEDGHGWVVPCDADEVWTAGDLTVRELLERQGPDVQVVTAALYDHVPTGVDPDLDDPVLRLGWRLAQPGVLPKVACRVHRKLTIHPGNHGADYGGLRFLAVDGLRIDHFTWRTPGQFVRKIRNGLEAYATVERKDIGVHWRMFEGATDEAIREHYHEWFHVQWPANASHLTYQPMEQHGGGYRPTELPS